MKEGPGLKEKRAVIKSWFMLHSYYEFHIDSEDIDELLQDLEMIIRRVPRL